MTISQVTTTRACEAGQKESICMFGPEEVQSTYHSLEMDEVHYRWFNLKQDLDKDKLKM